MTTNIGHPVVFLIFGNTITAAPCPVDESRETAPLVHVPAVVLIGEDAPQGVPVQQVVTFGKPCLITSSVQTVFAVIDHIGHQPLVALTEHRGAVYLMVVVGGGYHHTVFIGSAYLVVDALHHLLFNA